MATDSTPTNTTNHALSRSGANTPVSIVDPSSYSVLMGSSRDGQSSVSPAPMTAAPEQRRLFTNLRDQQRRIRVTGSTDEIARIDI